MRWKKLGNIFNTSGQNSWMFSHAANPVAVPFGGDMFRIFFNSRDAHNRSSVGWIDIDLRAPRVIIRRAEYAALTPGEIGCFDDSGCSIGCVVEREGKLWLYYMGWNLGVTVPWRNSIGLALSTDMGLSFQRVSKAPIMDRSEVDPFTISYPWVLKAGPEWRMWYGSNLAWGDKKSDMDHMIKTASSSDGITWSRDGRVCIRPRDDTEYAFARPCVIRDSGLYRMWFAFRGDSYRIGYAESEDGMTWTRKPSALEPGPDEWDNASVEYPCVFEHAGRLYILYCGNGYGRTGFGLAVLERP